MIDTKSLVRGDIVEHCLSKDWLMVLNINMTMIECRTKSLEIREFYAFELQPQTKR